MVSISYKSYKTKASGQSMPFCFHLQLRMQKLDHNFFPKFSSACFDFGTEFSLVKNIFKQCGLFIKGKVILVIIKITRSY